MRRSVAASVNFLAPGQTTGGFAKEDAASLSCQGSALASGDSTPNREDDQERPSTELQTEADQSLVGDDPGGMPEPQFSGKASGTFRLAGLGAELAGVTVVFMAAGYLVDSLRGHQTGYATAAGTLIGFLLGMVRFIRDVRDVID